MSPITYVSDAGHLKITGVTLTRGTYYYGMYIHPRVISLRTARRTRHILAFFQKFYDC